MLGWLYISLGGAHSNHAQDAFAPMAKEITAAGGTQLCENGDNGHGIDNRQAWYQTYYSIPNTPGLTEKMETIAAQQDFKLNPNTNFMNQLKGVDGASAYGGEQFNPNSDYVLGYRQDLSLSLTINRQTSVALYCNKGEYGRKVPTDSKAILNFTLESSTINH